MDPQHCFKTLNSSEEKQVAYIFIIQHLFCISINSSTVCSSQTEWAWFFEES